MLVRPVQEVLMISTEGLRYGIYIDHSEQELLQLEP